MARVVKGGLIQCSNAINDESRPVAEIQAAMMEKHIPFIEDAARQGVQVLCLQEIFNGPYFCPGQDARWYDAAEPCPGPTVEALTPYARDNQMVMIVPIYEREQAGVYYNTAAVIDADGSYLGKYRKNHIPHTSGFWEKYFFKPGNLGYPVFQTRYATIGVYICYDRHFPEGARLLGLRDGERRGAAPALVRDVRGLAQADLEDARGGPGDGVRQADLAELTAEGLGREGRDLHTGGELRPLLLVAEDDHEVGARELLGRALDRYVHGAGERQSRITCRCTWDRHPPRGRSTR